MYKFLRWNRIPYEITTSTVTKLEGEGTVLYMYQAPESRQNLALRHRNCLSPIHFRSKA